MAQTALTNAPLRAVTEAEIEAYQKNGVVFLPAILPPAWVARIADGIDLMIARFSENIEQNALDLTARVAHLESRGMGDTLLRDKPAAPIEKKGRFIIRAGEYRDNDIIRDVMLHSPLPAIAGAVMRASKINVYDDQVLVKEAGSAARTAFHQDQGYFHVGGADCVAMWTSPDVVTRENGAMGYVPGSQAWGKEFKPNIFVSQMPRKNAQGEDQPDIEGNESAYGVVYYETQPGDVIVHNYRTLHGAAGNISATRGRRALSARYCGDDAYYRLKPSAPPQLHHKHDLKDGDPLDSDQFPVVWRRGQ